ncbi:TetR/AcrR family transcriptional regulator [Neobacillus sp. 114]|uniref:TetR/AcrR family transcriptional regulator n=1 Tax=Neobacillus sp. 114 TaxID=3048535 RepID=UPI001C213BB5|nr:TetR/AcrR family transcriptional regulator [Neobacillus sp. 114]MBU8918036.1 TetR/AcrR family transcriptional regulator [Bacillus sp. FJAT-29953]
MARERKFSTEELFQYTKQLLLEHGYEGFTFSLLAERLEISRGAIYKYFENKEELITDFMLFEMKYFLAELKEIAELNDFDRQFEFLFELIFRNREIHQLIEIGRQIPSSLNEKVRNNTQNLEKMHLEMYSYMQNFVTLGKGENKLKPHIPDVLVLGIIFQTIAIPNHFGIPQDLWVQSIKEIISHGMFTNK